MMWSHATAVATSRKLVTIRNRSMASEYEQLRLRNIARNDAVLDKLGLKNKALKAPPQPRKPARKRTRDAAPREGERKSTRARTAVSTYGGADMDDDESDFSPATDGYACVRVRSRWRRRMRSVCAATRLLRR